MDKNRAPGLLVLGIVSQKLNASSSDVHIPEADLRQLTDGNKLENVFNAGEVDGVRYWAVLRASDVLLETHEEVHPVLK